MTAVEFIFEELENRENGSPHFTMQQIYNKAKEMEKQQIIDAWNDVKICDSGYKDAEQYYNETFKNK
jgi:hypothetical protein